MSDIKVRYPWIKSKSEQQLKFLKILLFILWPFGALLVSLKRINSKSSYVIFFLFCVLFGWNFTVHRDSTSDSIRYVEKFNDIVSQSWWDYSVGLHDFLSFKGDTKDYFFETVAFFVSRLTANYHVLLTCFAAIFAFFYLKSLEFITTASKYKNTLMCFFIVFLFTLSNSIYNINGVRFWTASWVAVYCIFLIFVKQDRRAMILLACIPFIHGAFWLFNAVFVFASLLMWFDRTWLVIAYISIPLSYLSVEVANHLGDYAPSFLQQSIVSYASYESVLAKQIIKGSGWTWLQEIFKFVETSYMNIMLILLAINRKTILKNPNSKYLYKFLLVYLSFVNFTMVIPSVGVRFTLLATPFLLLLWMQNYGDIKYRGFIYAIPFVFSFKAIYIFNHDYLSVIDWSFFASNSIYQIFNNI